MAAKKKTEAFHPPDRARAKELYASLRPIYDEALREIYLSVRTLLEEHDFTPTIKYRVKRFDDYYEKLLRNARKKKRTPVITDLLGLRIICPFLEDVERVEKLIGANFEIVEVVRKASGHSFREFGYDSVHLLVRLRKIEHAPPLPHTRRICEIQLRTILQDAWAEVEHELVYKSRLSWPNESIRRKLAALNATLTLSDLTFQEIRDYQKSVVALGDKRRSALERTLQVSGIEWPPVEQPAPPLDEPLTVVHGSPLEKAMVQALEVHSRNQFERAVELYSGILSMRMSRKIRSIIYNHRGMAHFSLSRSAEALKDFSRAIDYDEENLRARCNRGMILRMQKRLAHSLEDYDRALDSDPSLCEALLGRAQTYLEMEFPDRALKDCEKALSIRPDFSAARELRSKIHREFFRT